MLTTSNGNITAHAWRYLIFFSLLLGMESTKFSAVFNAEKLHSVAETNSILIKFISVLKKLISAM
jgi:hypothetical protein